MGSRHFNNKKPGCLDATIKIGIPVTIYRFWVMNGSYQVIILEGQTLKPKRHLLGNNGLVQFPESLDLVSKFDDWIQKGFPHHVCCCWMVWTCFEILSKSVPSQCCRLCVFPM